MSAYLSGYKLSCTDYDLAPTKLNIRVSILTTMLSWYIFGYIHLVVYVLTLLKLLETLVWCPLSADRDISVSLLCIDNQFPR